MKKIIKYIMVIAVASSTMFFTSCETIELEEVENPNGLSPDQADPDLLLNSVQLAYLSNIAYFNGRSTSLTRGTLFGSRDYFAGITPISVNAVWTRTYSTTGTRGMIPNVFAIEDANTAAGDGSLNYQEAVAKTLLAHNMMLLVDFIGDVPFSETNNPDVFPSPNLDSGASVYQASLSLLNEAEGLFSEQTGTDLFYNIGTIGDSDQWIRLINTIRMKAALTTGDIATFMSIESAGNFINDSSDDFEFTYGSNDVNPDERHPDYAADYTPAGANIYQSNWFMKQMIDNNDPRIRYYFFRQTGCTPGASCNPNPSGTDVTELQCSILQPPAHFSPDFLDNYCFLEDGYWGRDHADDGGVGPDGLVRTAVGVYPSGGRLDGDFFRNGTVEENDNGTDDDTSDDFFEFVLNEGDDFVNLGLGGEGAGIEPFILSSYVDFMRAEVALANGDVAGAASLIRNALETSITKVQSFGALDATFAGSDLLDGTIFNTMTGEVLQGDEEIAANVLPTTQDNTDFVDDIIAEFNAGNTEDQWNVLSEQLWITQYGGGAETYNFYRRTGFPNTLQPSLEPNPGTFPRSIPYPQNEVVANPNIAQKADQTVQVFWDTNPPSAVTGGFPASN